MAGRNLRAKRANTAGLGQSGQAAVLSIVWMVVLLGMAGLVIDVGSWYRSQRNLQAQADASALAGAQDLPSDTVTAKGDAQSWASKNGISLSASGVSIGNAAAPNDSRNDPREGRRYGSLTTGMLPVEVCRRARV